MSDLLQVSDLEKAKMHDTFHSEVITGKAEGLAGGADIDFATNAVTGQVQKTLPKIINDLDWSPVGLFAGGVTFTKITDFAIDNDGTQWIYIGTYPFTATAGTIPSEPTYQVVHVKSASAISNANGGSVQDFIDKVEGGDLTVIADGSTTPRRLGERFADVVNVKDFGVVGDGLIDDTSNFLLALQYAESQNKVLTSDSPLTINLETWTEHTQTAPISMVFQGQVTIKGPNLTTNFITITDDLHIEGFTCENFLADFSYSNLTTPKKLKAHKYKSKDSRRAIVRTRVNSTGILEKIEITECSIDHGGVDPILDTRGFFIEGDFEEALVAFNSIRNVHGHGINLGDNDITAQSNCKNMRVIGNHLQDLSRDGSGEIQAIRCYGNKAIVADNIIIDVTNSTENNAEGIYTKCRYSIVANNNLLDAGRSEASINVKGGTRDGAGDGPDGYAVQVVNNIIRASKPNVKGISLRTDDCLCSGNYLENITGEQGIYTVTNNINNLSIINNVFRDHRGRLGIYVRSVGKNYEIRGNKFQRIEATGTVSIVQAILVDSNAGEIENLTIDGNLLDLDFTLATSETRGIEVTGANDINGCRINNNSLHIGAVATTNKGILIGSNFATSTGWEITDNVIDGNLTETNKLLLSSYPDNMNIADNLAGRATEDITLSGITLRALYSGQKVSNTTLGTTNVSLPPAKRGLEYSFVRTGGLLRINAQVGEVLRFNGTTLVQLGAVGSSFSVMCVEDGVWDTKASSGTVT